MKFILALLALSLSAPCFAANLGRIAYGSTSVTTGAYVTVIASVTNGGQSISVCDSSTATMKIAIGDAGSEVDIVEVHPSTCVVYPVSVKSGTRVSVEAVSGTASSGELNVTVLPRN